MERRDTRLPDMPAARNQTEEVDLCSYSTTGSSKTTERSSPGSTTTCPGGYGKVQKLRESLSDDVSVHILLQGCVEPDLKDPALKERYGGATPAETVKAMLLPGEIEDLSRAVEKLCGYRRTTIDEVKNA